MQQVIFIVDQLENDECLGFTNDITKINHNLERLPKDFLPTFWRELEQSNDGLTLILSLGRYICIIAMAKNKSKGSLYFFDTQQKDDLAKKICENLNSEPQKIEFMNQHFRLQPFYEEHYNDVVLSKEKSIFN